LISFESTSTSDCDWAAGRRFASANWNSVANIPSDLAKDFGNNPAVVVSTTAIGKAKKIEGFDSGSE
jgi:hypothetical protein